MATLGGTHFQASGNGRKAYIFFIFTLEQPHCIMFHKIESYLISHQGLLFAENGFLKVFKRMANGFIRLTVKRLCSFLHERSHISQRQKSYIP